MHHIWRNVRWRPVTITFIIIKCLYLVCASAQRDHERSRRPRDLSEGLPDDLRRHVVVALGDQDVLSKAVVVVAPGTSRWTGGFKVPERINSTSSITWLHCTGLFLVAGGSGFPSLCPNPYQTLAKLIWTFFKTVQSVIPKHFFLFPMFEPNPNLFSEPLVRDLAFSSTKPLATLDFTHRWSIMVSLACSAFSKTSAPWASWESGSEVKSLPMLLRSCIKRRRRDSRNSIWLLFRI